MREDAAEVSRTTLDETPADGHLDLARGEVLAEALRGAGGEARLEVLRAPAEAMNEDGLVVDDQVLDPL